MKRAHAIVLVLLGVLALAVNLALGGTALGLLGLAVFVAGTVGLLLDAMPLPVERSVGEQDRVTLRHPFLH
jgi:membrane-bound ClpP family serine protease